MIIVKGSVVSFRSKWRDFFVFGWQGKEIVIRLNDWEIVIGHSKDSLWRKLCIVEQGGRQAILLSKEAAKHRMVVHEQASLASLVLIIS